MAFNGPINGDYSNCIWTQPPWVAGIAELTHDEVVYVKEQCAIVAVGHETDDLYIQTKYNEVTNYEKAINGETYFCIKNYNPEVNLLGIDTNGIIQPVEVPVEEEPPVEPEQPIEEEQTEEVPAE